MTIVVAIVARSKFTSGPKCPRCMSMEMLMVSIDISDVSFA